MEASYRCYFEPGVKVPSEDSGHRQMARERGTTVADVIRRAIWIEKYLHETLKSGGKVLLEDSDHGVRELVIR